MFNIDLSSITTVDDCYNVSVLIVMEEQTYYLRLVAVNINKHNKRSNNKMNYSNQLLLKLILQCSNRRFM